MSDYARGFEEGLAQGLGLRDELRAGLDGPSPATPGSKYVALGACGHELDPWEGHLEHHPECPADAPCTCPEVCPGCCLECS